MLMVSRRHSLLARTQFGMVCTFLPATRLQLVPSCAHIDIIYIHILYRTHIKRNRLRKAGRALE